MILDQKVLKIRLKLRFTITWHFDIILWLLSRIQMHIPELIICWQRWFPDWFKIAKAVMALFKCKPPESWLERVCRYLCEFPQFFVGFHCPSRFPVPLFVSRLRPYSTLANCELVYRSGDTDCVIIFDCRPVVEFEFVSFSMASFKVMNNSKGTLVFVVMDFYRLRQ